MCISEEGFLRPFLKKNTIKSHIMHPQLCLITNKMMK